MFQFTPISKNIQIALNKRVDALNRNRGSALEPVQFSMDEMLTKACWAQVTCPVISEKNLDKDKTNDEPPKFFRLSSAFKDGQPLNKPLASQQSLYSNDKNATFRPHSGIQGITTSFKTSYGLQEVVITWKFHDINDFEKYENALLKHGRLALVEFGWSKNNGINLQKEVVEDASDMLKVFKGTNKQIKQAGGDYYAVLGKVTSFDYKINESGGFDCTTTLTSMGGDFFKGKVEEVPEKKVPEAVTTSNQKTLDDALASANFYFTKFMENIDENLKIAQKKGELGVYHDGEFGWCNWAYFEDIVLNSFFGWTTESYDASVNEKGEIEKKNDNETLLTQIRSTSIKYNVDEDGNLDKSNIIQQSTPCRTSDNLWTSSIDAVLPGKIPGLESVKSDGEKLSGEVGELMKQKFGDTETYKKYVKLFKNFQDINEKFADTPFVQDNRGRIRNFVFSGRLLKDQFGGGIHNLESGLDSFWSTINSYYGNYWDFEIINDTDNNGKIGVIDKYTTEKRIADVNPETSENWDERKSFEGQDVYLFSNYGKNSLMKSFDLTVNMSSEQATMAMYHTNKNIGTSGNSTSNTTSEDLGVLALATLQNVEVGQTQEGKDNKPQVDKVFNKITYPFQQNKMHTYMGDQNKVKLQNVPTEYTKQLGDKSPEEVEAEIQGKLRNEEEVNEFTEAYNDFDKDNPENAGLIYRPDGNMIASYEKTMLYLLTKSPKTILEIDPLVPVEISFTIPGIGGIDLFDMFAVDYLPELYRKYAIFQVKSQEHSIDGTGWTTTITGQMRIDMQLLEAQKGKIVDDGVKIITPTAEKQINFIDITIAQKEQEDAVDAEPSE